ncbi:major facilitator superfamily transporter [Diaporthe amygdali]|uniref:major facilitator superfamily transporter n=1 Tax=Phomopsis amygdali TaxID=1214568 RepID=UPI0022FDF592|nr:major facilitator superfamily transporter [Diaporthe amygdali]KAJ0124262.1 major facilitator superfamily transporter [Diaporthe amygdali]
MAPADQDAENHTSSTTQNMVEKDTPKDVVETDSSASETKPARTIPNGGLQAWLQVVGAFFLYFNTWGLLSSYGSFQAYYETSLLENYTPFEISTIGSVQSFLLVFLGFVTGSIYDAGYYRYLLGAGSLLVFFGTLMQSFCTEFWQLLLAQGFCIGIGCGCLSIMTVAITALWFNTKLPIANGIAACGSGVGGVIFPIVIKNLLPKIGFGWTVRTIALIVLVTLTVCNIVLRGPGASAKRRALVHRESLTDWPYVALIFAYFTVFLGLYTPFFYVESFAVSTGITSEDTAFYLLAIVNLSSIIGRIIPNIHLAGMMGPMNMITITTICLAATSLGFIGVKNAAGVFVVSVVYGFFTGTFFALQPTIFVRLTGDMSVMGTRFGMAFSIMSFGLLIGSPISGVLQRAFGSYNASWVWAAITVAGGSILLGVARTLKVGPKVAIKI